VAAFSLSSGVDRRWPGAPGRHRCPSALNVFGLQSVFTRSLLPTGQVTSESMILDFHQRGVGWPSVRVWLRTQGSWLNRLIPETALVARLQSHSTIFLSMGCEDFSLNSVAPARYPASPNTAPSPAPVSQGEAWANTSHVRLRGANAQVTANCPFLLILAESPIPFAARSRWWSHGTRGTAK
jgi:hypothetical protein